MKAVIICSLLLVQVRLAGQGIIVFQNSAQNVNAPVTNAAGNLIVAPSPYVADLFWSEDTSASMDSLTAFNMPVSFSTNPGYFYGGLRRAAAVPTLAQVRVWDNTYGSTYYEARNNGGEFGFSNLLIITPDIPPGSGAYLIGLKGFQLRRLPSLSISSTTTNMLLLSWPVEQTSYLVQQTPDLSPTNWTTVPCEPVIVGQQQRVTLPAPTKDGMFYRLISN